jgi:hypothetical protein
MPYLLENGFFSHFSLTKDISPQSLTTATHFERRIWSVFAVSADPDAAQPPPNPFLDSSAARLLSSAYILLFF